MIDSIKFIFSRAGIMLLTLVSLIILFVTSGTPNPHDIIGVGLEEYKIKVHSFVLMCLVGYWIIAFLVYFILGKNHQK